jgi:hypothetical protein
MKARRLPGVRCSTLNTECKSLLCLMIMPGRSWVAGIDIAVLHLLQSAGILDSGAGRSGFRRTWNQPSILHREDGFWELERLQVLLQ